MKYFKLCIFHKQFLCTSFFTPEELYEESQIEVDVSLFQTGFRSIPGTFKEILLKVVYFLLVK